MNPYDHKGKKYININGKDFYLIRGYRDRERYQDKKLIFLQVYGKSPLNPEDLDKDFDILKTKTLERKLLEPKSIEPKIIYTAFRPKFFDYSGIGEDQKKLYFIGMTQRGSLFLVFHFLKETYKIKISDQELNKTIDKQIKKTHYEIKQSPDQGNSQISAYYVEFGRWDMNEDKAREIFKI